MKFLTKDTPAGRRAAHRMMMVAATDPESAKTAAFWSQVAYEAMLDMEEKDRPPRRGWGWLRWRPWSRRAPVPAILPAITSDQLVRLGSLGRTRRRRRWFCSFYAEEGDPDLYVQDLDNGESWKIDPAGRWAYLGR